MSKRNSIELTCDDIVCPSCGSDDLFVHDCSINLDYEFGIGVRCGDCNLESSVRYEFKCTVCWVENKGNTT